jgi:protein disulfide-isomerase
MRSFLFFLLSLATVATTSAAEIGETTSTDDLEEEAPSTIFNGRTVPPMKELGSPAADVDEAISKGNW